MIDRIDLQIIGCLRANCRLTIQDIANEANIDVNVCRSRSAAMRKMGLFTRYCSIIDCSKIDFHITAGIFLASEELDQLAHWLLMQPNLNNLQLLHGEYDLYLEALFRDMRDLCEFYENMGRFKLLRLREYHLIEQTKENFLCHNSELEFSSEPEPIRETAG